MGLLSTATDLAEGAKADADVARRRTRAADFMVNSSVFLIIKNDGDVHVPHRASCWPDLKNHDVTYADVHLTVLRTS